MHTSVFKKRGQIRGRSRWLLLIGILAAFALRLYRLGSDSLWYDETVSVELARKSLAGLLVHTAGDIHPPGYYLLLHGWQQLTAPQVFAAADSSSSSSGALEFLYAWPSFCFGVLLVALLFALGRRLFAINVGLLAAWLAIINPYQIWYSQEVRMYTLIASLGLVCLYMLLKWLDQPVVKFNRYLTIYIFSAAAGLYSHYYLLFGLVALNLIAFGLIIFFQKSPVPHFKEQEWDRTSRGNDIQQTSARGKRLIYWIGAQLGVLILWLPWLPTFWRQATDPPVPPWREPWTFSTFGTALYESTAALFVGQSLPSDHPNQVWGWMLCFSVISIILLIAQSASKRTQQPYNPNAWPIVVVYIFVPVLLLYSITMLGTPVYHVRYLFLFAPLFLLIIARGLLTLWQQNRILFSGVLAGLLILNTIALDRFWHSPAYQADDHRRAVAALANNWRPNDLILINAGWTYTALNTYWPTAINNAHNSLPNRPEQRRRLSDYAQGSRQDSTPTAQPDQTSVDQLQIIYSGTIDGDPNLGWGSPNSDFYAITEAEMNAALSNLAQQHARIWHYRLYDTNSDPTGTIRRWLDQNATQLDDQLFAGPASLRVQLFDTGLKQIENNPKRIPINVNFNNALLFDYAQYGDTIETGQILYIETEWSPLPDLAAMPANLRFSLRLYAEKDDLIVQHDQSPLPPTSSWSAKSKIAQTFALPIPAGLRPDIYSLELVAYREDTGQAVALPELPQTIYRQRLQIGSIAVQPATIPFYPPNRVATFDYIDLLTAEVDQTKVDQTGVSKTDAAIHARLTWRPRINSYTDTYIAIFELRTASNTKEILQTWREPAGGPSHLSGEWVAEVPINEKRLLPLGPQIEAGTYQLTLRLERASDELPIDARVGWRTQESVIVATIEIAK